LRYYEIMRLIRLFAVLFLLSCACDGIALAQINIPEAAQERPPTLEQLQQGPQALPEQEIAWSLQYYDRCMEVPDPSVALETQRQTCACMAEQVRTSLTAPEMQFMATGGGGTTVPRMKLFERIYGPCMKYAGWEHSYFQCYNHQGLRTSVTETNTFLVLCDCIAHLMSEFFELAGPYQSAAMLSVMPELEDPFGAIINSSAYNREYEKSSERCSLYSTGYRSRP